MKSDDVDEDGSIESESKRIDEDFRSNWVEPLVDVVAGGGPESDR